MQCPLRSALGSFGVRVTARVVQIEVHRSSTGVAPGMPLRQRTALYWLQGITLVWMLAECGLSLYAAKQARSPAMLAFGSDSLVELLSSAIVLLQYLPRWPISERKAARGAGVLLFLLAAIVSGTALISFLGRLRPQPSGLGIGITLAALVGMPILAALKRREARRSQNVALAADAVQSAMCANLAAIALAGLAINALFHVAWFDSVAALAATPLLIREGRAALRGKTCACC